MERVAASQDRAFALHRSAARLRVTSSSGSHVTEGAPLWTRSGKMGVELATQSRSVGNFGHESGTEVQKDKQVSELHR